MTVEAGKVRGAGSGTTFTGSRTWWIQPVSVAVGFSLFVIYATWSVVFGSGGHGWEHGPYLSPFYSPLLKLSWWPLSSAILIAWAPLGFRATCYYYRKAYYRAFFWDPPACAINEPRFRGHYHGERRLPWILNNFHRFFLYLAGLVLLVLWFDTLNAFHYKHGLYIGIGSVLMLLNVILISLYTFSCHALRHLVGGSLDCFSCVRGGKARHGLWGQVSRFNPYHGVFAWLSLISVAGADIYIRVVSAAGNCFGTHTGC